jgi:hypothetical protein
MRSRQVPSTKFSRGIEALLYLAKDRTVDGVFNDTGKSFNPRNPTKKKEKVKKKPTESFLIWRREYDRQRRRVPSTKVRENLSRALRSVLKKNGGIKKSSILLYIGCSVDELRAHIQQQFQPGMNWENTKEWHIDHIRPCASFDLTREEDVYECFNYKNLQPLWAEENIKKGSTWAGKRHYYKK